MLKYDLAVLLRIFEYQNLLCLMREKIVTIYEKIFKKMETIFGYHKSQNV